jgi:acyl dehydratase
MLEVETPKDLAALAGRELGVSAWRTIDQGMIDQFAAATGDDQWIHVDVARAGTEMPGGKTIAHGLLTLSLIPRMWREVFKVTHLSRGLNYGSDKIRYLTPVPSGGRVRSRVTLKRAEPIAGGFRYYFETAVELEGAPKPALVAEMIAQMYD